VNSFLFDASGLSKRYTLELGYQLIDHLIANLKIILLKLLNYCLPHSR
jgi:hypothetical protein